MSICDSVFLHDRYNRATHTRPCVLPCNISLSEYNGGGGARPVEKVFCHRTNGRCKRQDRHEDTSEIEQLHVSCCPMQYPIATSDLQ